MGKEYERDVLVLGSIPSLGRVILYDNMEGLFKWTDIGTGGNKVFEKSTAKAYNDSASLHMKTRTIGAAEDDVIRAERACYQRPGKRYRFEVLWLLAVNADCKLLKFQSKIYDGTLLHTVLVLWDPQNFKWQYFSSAGANTDVPNGSQTLKQDVWHRFALWWDESTKKFIKLESDGLEMDLSTLGYYTFENAGALQNVVSVEISTQAAAATEANLDDALILEI